MRATVTFLSFEACWILELMFIFSSFIWLYLGLFPSTDDSARSNSTSSSTLEVSGGFYCEVSDLFLLLVLVKAIVRSISCWRYIIPTLGTEPRESTECLAAGFSTGIGKSNAPAAASIDLSRYD